MIVKMRKITVMLSRKETDSALEKLRGLGVVHVSHLRKPYSENIDELSGKLSLTEKSLESLQPSGRQEELEDEKVDQKCAEILKLEEKREKLKERLEKLNLQKSWFSKWGKISKSDLKILAGAGVYVGLYISNVKELKKIDKDRMIYVINKSGKILHLAHITRDKEDDLRKESSSIRKAELPEMGLQKINSEIEQIREEISNTQNLLENYGKYFEGLAGYRDSLKKRIEFMKVKHGMFYEESIACLQGFCPVKLVSKVKETAEKNGWGIAVSKPSDDDDVPTLVENPGWIDIVKPVFNFMGTVPGYKEFDISFWFLVFFSLFFAMIVGDAGYGLIFIAATYLLRRKFREAPSEPFSLFYLLSGATVLWGALTGTWFGSETIARLPFFDSVSIDRIGSFVEGSQDFVIFLTFIIGVVHLSIARMMRAFNLINTLKAISELGWVAVLWAAYFLAGMLVLNRPLPGFAVPLGITGAAAVLLFSNFQRNVAKGILKTIGNLPLDIISSFTDIISYIRLFAVGYATVVVAAASNEFAAGVGLGGAWGGLISATILFAGHGLNILLCLMSVIVHGIRLNLLEFSGQLGMEWTGKKYRPFR